MSPQVVSLTRTSIPGLLLALLCLTVPAAQGLIGGSTEALALRLRERVETAHGILAHFEAEERAGRMDRAAAQAAAVATLGALRYAGREPFWIQDHRPRMILHPLRPELEGRNLSATVDPGGRALFREMVAVVQTGGAGLVTHQAPRPGAGAPVERLAYVQGFEPWGWIVGSGLDADAAGEPAHPSLPGPLAVLPAACVGLLAYLIGRGPPGRAPARAA